VWGGEEGGDGKGKDDGSQKKFTLSLREETPSSRVERSHKKFLGANKEQPSLCFTKTEKKKNIVSERKQKS